MLNFIKILEDVTNNQHVAPLGDLFDPNWGTHLAFFVFPREEKGKGGANHTNFVSVASYH